MSELKGAEVIAEYLVREGVPYVVGLCGHGDLGLLDALYDRQSELTTLSVHHESVAGFMADAYFRVTGRPLATFTSCGPGSANLPVALGSAFMDASAFLAITGNVPTSQFNRNPFQETGRHFQADFPSVVRPYVKRSFQATRADQLPLMLRQAFSTMTAGRPGPVHLDVPLDVFVERTAVPVPDPREWRDGVSRRVAAHDDDVQQVVEMLLRASRPVIVLGRGAEVAGGGAAIVRIAELLGIPFASSPLGRGVIDNRHELYLGATGRNGTYQANRATRSADLVVAFGTRFDDRSTSSWMPGYTYSFPATDLVHIDIDPAELGRNFPLALGIAADPRTTAEQMHASLSRHRDAGDDRARDDAAVRREWRASAGSWAETWTRDLTERVSTLGTMLRPERVVDELRRALPDDGIVVSDVGVHHNWLVQNWECRVPGGLLQSWGFASMGFGVAGNLGVRLAAPERPIVSVVGDGGFMMFPSVVATAVQYDLPAIWLVWNNGGYMSIRDQQRAYFGRDRELATSFAHQATGEPYSADYAAMARSLGGEGRTVAAPGELEGAVAEALRSGRPTVIDVKIDPDVAPPAVASWDLPPLPHPQPNYRWPDVDDRG